MAAKNLITQLGLNLSKSFRPKVNTTKLTFKWNKTNNKPSKTFRRVLGIAGGHDFVCTLGWVENWKNAKINIGYPELGVPHSWIQVELDWHFNWGQVCISGTCTYLLTYLHAYLLTYLHGRPNRPVMPPPPENSRVKILLGRSQLSNNISCTEKNIGRVGPGGGGVDDPPPRK